MSAVFIVPVLALGKSTLIRLLARELQKQLTETSDTKWHQSGE